MWLDIKKHTLHGCPRSLWELPSLCFHVLNPLETLFLEVDRERQSLSCVLSSCTRAAFEVAFLCVQYFRSHCQRCLRRQEIMRYSAASQDQFVDLRTSGLKTPSSLLPLMGAEPRVEAGLLCTQGNSRFPGLPSHLQLRRGP